MGREELGRYLEQGLSLREIGERVGLDRSTIGKMAHRHRLEVPGRLKFAAKPIDRNALVELVERDATVHQIAKHFGVTAVTARKHLARHGLRTARSEGLRKRRLALESPAAETSLCCIRHGQTRFVLDTRGSWRCLRCRSEAVARRRRKVKSMLVEEAGGACQVCGYSRHLGALHFHHRDPSEKEFGLSYGGFSTGVEKLRREARKCVLLCSNCHAEVEGGIVRMPAA